MFCASSVLTTITLAVAASSLVIQGPLVTLPIAKRINITGSTLNLHQRDKARAQHLKQIGAARTGGVVSDAIFPPPSIPATNEAVFYVANVRNVL